MFMPHQQEIEEYPGVVPRISRLTITDNLPFRSTWVKKPVVRVISHGLPEDRFHGNEMRSTPGKYEQLPGKMEHGSA